MRTDNYLLLKFKQLFALDGNIKSRFAKVNSDIAASGIRNSAIFKLNKNEYDIDGSNKNIDDNGNNKINVKRFWFYAESIGEVKIALYLCDLIKRNIKTVPVFFISIKTASAYKILENYSSRSRNVHNNGSNYNAHYCKDIIYFFSPANLSSYFFNSYAALIKPDCFISIENSINSKYAEILYNNNNNVKIYLLDLNLKKEKFLKNYKLLDAQILNNIYVNITDDEDKINLQKHFGCIKSADNLSFAEEQSSAHDFRSCTGADNDKDFKKVLSPKEKINIVKISDLPLKIASSFNNYCNENDGKNVEEIKDMKEIEEVRVNRDIKEVKKNKQEDTDKDKYDKYKDDTDKDIAQNADSIIISFISVHKKEIVFLPGILRSVNEHFLKKNIKLKFIFAPRNIKTVSLIKKIAGKNNFKALLYKKDNADINIFVKKIFANSTKNIKNSDNADEPDKQDKQEKQYKYDKHDKFDEHDKYKDADILIIDDYGKLDEVYENSDIIYVGKSLFKEESGGHNILEPILYSKAVITGPYIDNFKNIADAYLKADAVKVIEKDFFLNDFINFIENEAQWKDMGKKSHDIFKKQKEQITKNLNCFVNNEFIND
jgi:3-deoxy-D-manno-octulosonic-acid transferase